MFIIFAADKEQHRTENKHDLDEVGLNPHMFLTRWRQSGGSSPESTGVAVAVTGMLFNFDVVSGERQGLYLGLKTWTMAFMLLLQTADKVLHWILYSILDTALVVKAM